MAVEKRYPVPSDLEIAQETELKPITEIAKICGITDDELEPYGKYMAKVSLNVLDRLKDMPSGKFITVTAITPTPLGEGKTVTNLGLGQAMFKVVWRRVLPGASHGEHQPSLHGGHSRRGDVP